MLEVALPKKSHTEKDAYLAVVGGRPTNRLFCSLRHFIPSCLYMCSHGVFFFQSIPYAFY